MTGDQLYDMTKRHPSELRLSDDSHFQVGDIVSYCLDAFGHSVLVAFWVAPGRHVVPYPVQKAKP